MATSSDGKRRYYNEIRGSGVASDPHQNENSGLPRWGGFRNTSLLVDATMKSLEMAHSLDFDPSRLERLVPHFLPLQLMTNIKPFVSTTIVVFVLLFSRFRLMACASLLDLSKGVSLKYKTKFILVGIVFRSKR
jgi:hypothetical protein